MRLHIADVEPLTSEVVDERLRFRVGQHPPDLLLHHLGPMQRSFRGQVEKRFVGNTAPDEEGQPRRQVDVAEPIRHVRRDSRWLALRPEEEFRAHQDAAERHFDARFEATLLGAGAIPRQGYGDFRSRLRDDDRRGARASR